MLDGMNYRPAAPRQDMTPQIIWLGRCFIVATTYFLSKHLPNGRLICMWRGTNCCMIHSSEHDTFFHSASPISTTTGKVQSLFFHHCGFRAGLCDFSPNSLLRRLETVLELIAVPLSAKQHGFSRRSSLASAILYLSH